MKYHLPVYLWMGVIFFVSSLPRVAPFPVTHLVSRMGHLVEYAVLGALLLRSFTHLSFSTSASWLIGAAFLVGTLYAASDEMHQFFVPGRSMEFGDWVTDCAGVIFGIFFRKNKWCR